jgi:hypothetical protein
MPIMGVAKFERFFRSAAGLSVDKDDLRRYSDFTHQKLYDLLTIGQATARANERDTIEPWDLPITKGLQESIHQYKKLDEAIDLQPILNHLATLPQLDLEVSDDTHDQLPAIVGGLSVALGATLKTIEPELKVPHARQWQTAFRIFDQLL